MCALIIFLLPTLAIFYFLAFIKLVISVLVLQIGLVMTQIILVNFPFHLYKLVDSNPYILPNCLEIEIYYSNRNHMKMKPLPSNKASLFIKLLDEFKKI